MSDARQIPYLVLSATSDDVRNERLNYGLVVLAPEGPVVRFDSGAVRRLKHLHPDYAHWSSEDEEAALLAALKEASDPGTILALTYGIDADQASGSIHLYDAHDPGELDRAVEDLLVRLVMPPGRSMPRPKSKAPSRSKLAVQLKSWFRQAKVYSSNAEDLNKGRVVGNFPVAARDDLFADFAVKNGRLHVIETLDLRGIDHLTATLRGDAAVKGITLDEARNAVDGERIAVVSASNPGAARPAIKMVSRYASNVYVLESPKDRQDFVDFMHETLHGEALPMLNLAGKRTA